MEEDVDEVAAELDVVEEVNDLIGALYPIGNSGMRDRICAEDAAEQASESEDALEFGEGDRACTFSNAYTNGKISVGSSEKLGVGQMLRAVIGEYPMLECWIAWWMSRSVGAVER